MLAFILNIIILIGVIGVLVFVHELGHFLVAIWNGVEVNEFALGMGPKLFSIKRKGITYSLRAFPIGGFVSILGEDETPDDPKLAKKIKESKRSLPNKRLWQRVAIMIAGVTMNVILAVTIYYVILASTGFKFALPDNSSLQSIKYGEVSKVVAQELQYSKLVKGGNAEKASWPDKAYIKAIDGVEVETSDKMREILSKNKGKTLEFTLCLKEKSKECDAYDVKVADTGVVGISTFTNYYYEVKYSGTTKVFAGFAHSINVVNIAFSGLGKIFSDAKQSGDYSEAVNSVGGPVSLYFIIDLVRGIGLLGILDLTASLSLTLAIMNILPIPALDGGRILLTTLRSILKEKFNPKLETWLVTGSYLILLLFMLVVFIKDIVFIQKFKELVDSLK